MITADGPRRVALISSLFPPLTVGGAELVVEQLAVGLAHEGVECHVITLTDEHASQHGQHDGVEVVRLPLRNLYWPHGRTERSAPLRSLWHVRDAWNRAMARSVGRELDRIRPDVVNTHNLSGFSAAIWSTVVDRGIPIVHTMHDQYLLCPRTTMYRDGRNCERQCAGCRLLTAPRRTQSGRPAVVTGPSRFIIDRHVAHGWFADVPTRVIHNAVRTPAIAEGQDRSSRSFRFGFLGRIAATKGIDRLVHAFLDLDRPGVELLIGGVGEPALEAELRAATHGRDDVRWLGFVDADRFLADIDVLVVPSTWADTAPLVVMEAFRHGVPVLGSNRGGIPELVAAGAGWTVDPDHHDAMVAALRERVDACAELDELAPICRRAAATHTVEHMVDGYRDAYRAAL